MYTVYLLDWNKTPTEDSPTFSSEELYIYDPITHDDGYAIEEPVLTLGASKVGEFTITLMPTNYGYGKIKKGRTRVVVKKDKKIIFMGKVVEDKRDLYLFQKIKAEGALTYLNDSLSKKEIITRTDYEGATLEHILKHIFDDHNAKFPTEPWKQFNLKVCEANFVGRDEKDATSNYISYYSVNYDKSLELVQELISLADGAFKIEYNEEHGYWDVYVYDKYNFPVASQPIEFGLNLMDLVQSYEYNDICTAVAPFGGDLIQVSKEIGDQVAGFQNNDWYSGINDPPATQGEVRPNPDAIARVYPDAIYVRPKEDPNAAYTIYSAQDTGYWVITFNVEKYNQAHPLEPLKRLYLSWRGFKFETHEGEEAGPNKVEDCAWRIYDASGNTLAFREFGDDGGFVSAINEEIDLTSAPYIGAQLIVMSGWGGLIKPVVRRDAPVQEENDKLSIIKCDAFGPDSDGLRHPQGSEYLYSDNLINLYGLIEKRLDTSIEDSLVPRTDWVLDFTHQSIILDTDGVKGNFYPATALAYDVTIPDSEEVDLNRNKGAYTSIPFGDNGYHTIKIELPEVGNPKRPRGVFISSRFHSFGVYNWDNKKWYVNGMYGIFDTSDQLLAFEEAGERNFTSVKNMYIDLSLPEYYGAKYIRVGAWGGNIPAACVPTDDKISMNRLMEQAKIYLKNYQWEKAFIEATAVDLNITSDEWETLDICTNVPVISEYHGISNTMPLTSLTLRLDDVEGNQVTVGYDSDEYMTTQLNTINRVKSVEEAIENKERSVNNAV